MISNDGLAWSCKKSQLCPPTPTYARRGSVVSRPSSNRSLDSTNSDKARTSEVRNWQSPLKSPQTRAAHGSHVVSCRRAGRGLVPSCAGEVRGSRTSMR
eukprot:7391991-Prymnesium_polylepis.2